MVRFAMSRVLNLANLFELLNYSFYRPALRKEDFLKCCPLNRFHILSELNYEIDAQLVQAIGHHFRNMAFVTSD